MVGRRAAASGAVVEWTWADSEAARAEGWDVFEADDGPQIQRLDEAAVLPDDGVAWRRVVEAALAGSVLHPRALAAVSTAERGRIVAHCCGGTEAVRRAVSASGEAV